jgi:hypothetical protein
MGRHRMLLREQTTSALHAIFAVFGVLSLLEVSIIHYGKRVTSSDREKSHDHRVVVVGLDFGRACDCLRVDG